MFFASIVYVLRMLDAIKYNMTFLAVALIFASAATTFVHFVRYEQEEDYKFKWLGKSWIILGAIIGLSSSVIPDEKTGVYMVSAYVVQDIVTNPTVQNEVRSIYEAIKSGSGKTADVGGKSMDLLNHYLDEQLEKYNKSK